jgi:hypothetical protein
MFVPNAVKFMKHRLLTSRHHPSRSKATLGVLHPMVALYSLRTACSNSKAETEQSRQLPRHDMSLKSKLGHFWDWLFQVPQSKGYPWHINAHSQDQQIAVLSSITLYPRKYLFLAVHDGVHIACREMIFDRTKLHPTFEPLEHISRATQKLPLTIIAWNDDIRIENVWVEDIEEQILYPDRLIVKGVKMFGDFAKRIEG